MTRTTGPLGKGRGQSKTAANSFGSRPTRGSIDWSVWPVGALGFDLGAPRRRSASTRDLATIVNIPSADGDCNNQEPGVRRAARYKLQAASCLPVNYLTRYYLIHG